MEVRCLGEVHPVTLRGGALVLDRHPWPEAERAVAGLGGERPACLDVYDHWRASDIRALPKGLQAAARQAAARAEQRWRVSKNPDGPGVPRRVGNLYADRAVPLLRQAAAAAAARVGWADRNGRVGGRRPDITARTWRGTTAAVHGAMHPVPGSQVRMRLPADWGPTVYDRGLAFVDDTFVARVVVDDPRPVVEALAWRAVPTNDHWPPDLDADRLVPVLRAARVAPDGGGLEWFRLGPWSLERRADSRADTRATLAGGHSRRYIYWSGYELVDDAGTLASERVPLDGARGHVLRVAGTTFRPDALQGDDLAPLSRLELVPEPDNPYDPDAIAVRTWGSAGRTIGYVPREDTHRLWRRKGFAWNAFVLRDCQDNAGRRLGLRFMAAPAGVDLALPAAEAAPTPDHRVPVCAPPGPTPAAAPSDRHR